MKGKKCESCDKGKEFLVQFMANGDEGDNPWMRDHVYCCGQKLNSICEEGDFGKGPGDSIIDIYSGNLYVDPKAAVERIGGVYVVSTRDLERAVYDDGCLPVF